MISSSPRESESSYIHHRFLFLSTLHRCRSLHHLMSSTKGVDAPFVLVDSSSLVVVAPSPHLRRRLQHAPLPAARQRGRGRGPRRSACHAPPAACSPPDARLLARSALAGPRSPREGLRRDAVAPPGPSSRASSRPRRPSSRPRRRPREDPRRRPPLLRLPRLRRELASSSRPQLVTASSASGRPDANSGKRSRMRPGLRWRRMRRRPRTGRDEGAAGAHFWIANSQIYRFLRPFFGSP